MQTWTDEQIKNYYLGIKNSDYPKIFWEKMKISMKTCMSIMDIGCGPGAFALKALEDGFYVYGIDQNEKHLNALRKASKDIPSGKLEIINNSWMDVSSIKSDASICAYSLGEGIGSVEGIGKVLKSTKKIAFFIMSYGKVQTDFSSKSLYDKLNVKPRTYSTDYTGILDIFNRLKEEVEYEIITYDFGMPFDEELGIKGNAMYLADKLGLPYSELVEEHIRNIMIEKDKILWIPNIKKSVLFTWRRK